MLVQRAFNRFSPQHLLSFSFRKHNVHIKIFHGTEVTYASQPMNNIYHSINNRNTILILYIKFATFSLIPCTKSSYWFLHIIQKCNCPQKNGARSGTFA